MCKNTKLKIQRSNRNNTKKSKACDSGCSVSKDRLDQILLMEVRNDTGIQGVFLEEEEYKKIKGSSS